MRLSVPRLGSGLETKKRLNFREFFRFLIIILVVIVLVAVGVVLYKHFFPNEEDKLAKNGVSSPTQFEAASNNVTNGFLKDKDYESYMDKQVLLASHYDASGDLTNAIRVMNEVFNKVPSSAVNTLALNEMANLQQEQGNTAQYKHYLELLVKRYQADGNTKAASDTQKILDSQK